MLRILLIEDENEKRRLLTEAILAVDGMQLENIDFAGDVLAAKRCIKNLRYELIILDINIPSRADDRSSVGAGLAVLSFIKNNVTAKVPGFVVGMTAYDDGFSAATGDFAFPLWKLVKFSHTDLSWKVPLQEAVRYLISLDRPPYVSDGKTFHTDLAIFVALEDVELGSIRRLDAGWVERKFPFDHTRYFEGEFVGEKGAISVVVVAAPKMGLPTAGVVATKLIEAYRPRYLAITGICAGVREKVRMGDLLVADPCFDWGSGKWLKDASGAIRFRPAPYSWRLDEGIRQSIKKLGESSAFLTGLHEKFQGNKPSHAPRVEIEAMASGGSVLQVGQLMDDVREQHKNLLGVEMESYSVFTAAEYASQPRPTCFSIKAVCDFGDEEKGDTIHEYAAYASAQFLFRFATEYLTEEVIG